MEPERTEFPLPSDEEEAAEKKKKRILILCIAVLTALCLVAGALVPMYGRELWHRFSTLFMEEEPHLENVPSWVDVQLIRVDGASRRGVKLEGLTAIVVHYVGNPGSSAQNNRDYFDNPDSTVSSHFVVGLEGEVIQCVPLDEKSSATGERNRDTISIEVCHPDETGAFLPETYDSLIRLLSWLCEEFSLTEEDIIRHYDVTGKKCPLYYVDHPEAWEALKQDVREYESEEI